MLVVAKLTIRSDLYHFYLVITALSFIFQDVVTSQQPTYWELEKAIIRSLQAN